MTTIIADLKSALPFEAVLVEAGINLIRGKALCPFHDDKNPSFSVKDGRGRCWTGCFSGDVVDFTAKYYGLDFKGALKLLADRAGIKPASTQAERTNAEAARREMKKKAELIKAFRQWEKETANRIAQTLRAHRHLLATRTDPFTEPEFQALAEIQGEIDILKYHYAILCARDDAEKFALYREEKT